MSRYHRQILLPQIGETGQDRLARSRVLLVGCGALGTVIADQLVRAGVGFLRLVDRDLVEWSNLQRQVLFDEQDARNSTPKAIAAAARLRSINSQIIIEPLVADVHSGNIEALARDVDVILDGTDNVATRYLLNDVAVKMGKPWIYGAAVGTEGRVMAILPRQTACLRCVFPEAPAAGELPTCDTAGVLGPVASVVASLQTVAAIKLLTNQPQALADQMLAMDLWTNQIRPISLAGARRADCPCCGLGKHEYLDAPAANSITVCGRDAVQIRGGGKIDLAALQNRLAGIGKIVRSPYYLRCLPHEPAGMELTVFPDGRTIVKGTADLIRARSLFDRFVGG